MKAARNELYDLLPSQLRRIADVVGFEAAMKLSARFPGIRIYIPYEMEVDHPVSMAIGAKAAEKLCLEYGGGDLVVAMASRIHKQRLNLQILEELDAGKTAQSLALKYGMHEMSIYRLASDRRKAEQGKLF